jgi:hypothetical protein
MTITVGIDLQHGDTIETIWPIRLNQVLRQYVTENGTYVAERIVPMNNAPRVLSTGIDAAMEDKNQERETSSRPTKEEEDQANCPTSSAYKHFMAPAQTGGA